MSLRRRSFFGGIKPPQVLSWVISTKSDPNAATYNRSKVAAMATAAGWDGESVVDLTITITSTGGLLGGLEHEPGFPPGSKVLLINQGIISGARGSAGYVQTSTTSSAYAGSAGGNGGHALTVSAPIIIQNTGVIAGGGGGGGGGGGVYAARNSTYFTKYVAQGTGGGVGAVYSGTPVTPADTPTSIYGSNSDNIVRIKGGRGGAGGSPGNPGSPGQPGAAWDYWNNPLPAGSYAAYGAGGPGGAAGKAVVGNAYITWLAPGTRIGAIT